MVRDARTSVAVLAFVVVAGCTGSDATPQAASGDGPRVVQPGAPGEETRELTEEELAAIERDTSHTDADVAFMQMMVPHHVQALRMIALVGTNSDDDRIALFAERMELSQQEELDLIRAWLEARDEPVPSLLGDHDHGGDGGDGQPTHGMLTEEEFAELEAAQGEAFDRLFLESMHRHHLGALQMVDELYEDGGGAEPEISRFADHVFSDQQIEIERMETLLAELD
jgi:uncharacterized protein (DUF305 family)